MIDLIDGFCVIFLKVFHVDSEAVMNFYSSYIIGLLYGMQNYYLLMIRLESFIDIFIVIPVGQDRTSLVVLWTL